MNTHSDTITGWRATLYDRLMNVFGARRVYVKTLALLDLSEGQHLLDVGCGTGTFLKLARQQYPHAELVGVDASEDMLAQARKTADSSITFAYADASALPFPNESFDWVVSILAFHHMPNGIKARAIQEIARVLKPKGKCLIADFGKAGTAWGAFNLFFLNWHSHTKGNMDFVERELWRWGFQKEAQQWHKGFVSFHLAQRRR